jgi:hypothetical protein
VPPIQRPISAQISRWLPLSLHWIYLIALVVISTALAIVCIALAAYSNVHNGLSNTNDGIAFTFSWRYLPTIAGVLYTLLWTPVMKDVLMTEPWALLSLAGGSKASASLLKGDSFWWIQAINSIRNKGKPGGIRWPVFISIAGSMIGSLAINPLSAGFLAVEQTTITQQKEFTTLAPLESPMTPLNISDSTYLKTIVNASTSAWLMDDFAVMPFWPPDLASAPLGPMLGNTAQVWSSNASVFKVQFECESLPRMSDNNSSSPNVIFKASDGCTLNLTVNDISNINGGPWGGVWGQFNVSSQPSVGKNLFSQVCRVPHQRVVLEIILCCTPGTAQSRVLKLSTRTVMWHIFAPLHT